MECLPLLSSKLLCALCGRTSCSNDESTVKCMTVSPMEECFSSSFGMTSYSTVGNIHGLPTLLHIRFKSRFKYFICSANRDQRWIAFLNCTASQMLSGGNSLEGCD